MKRKREKREKEGKKRSKEKESKAKQVRAQTLSRSLSHYLFPIFTLSLAFSLSLCLSLCCATPCLRFQTLYLVSIRFSKSFRRLFPKRLPVHSPRPPRSLVRSLSLSFAFSVSLSLSDAELTSLFRIFPLLGRGWVRWMQRARGFSAGAAVRRARATRLRGAKDVFHSPRSLSTSPQRRTGVGLLGGRRGDRRGKGRKKVGEPRASPRGPENMAAIENMAAREGAGTGQGQGP